MSAAEDKDVEHDYSSEPEEYGNGPSTYYCDNCKNRIPKNDVRWHCTECSDYDLCRTCKATGNYAHDPKHLFSPETMSPQECKAAIYGESFAETLSRIFKVYGHRTCFGERSYDYVHKEYTGEYQYLTYREVFYRVVNFGTGLLAVLRSTQDVNKTVLAEVRENIMSEILSDTTEVQETLPVRVGVCAFPENLIPKSHYSPPLPVTTASSSALVSSSGGSTSEIQSEIQRDHVIIISRVCLSYFIADYSCLLYSLIDSVLQYNLESRAYIHVIRQTEAKILVVEYDLVGKILDEVVGIPEAGTGDELVRKFLKAIVVMDPVPNFDLEKKQRRDYGEVPQDSKRASKKEGKEDREKKEKQINEQMSIWQKKIPGILIVRFGEIENIGKDIQKDAASEQVSEENATPQNSSGDPTDGEKAPQNATKPTVPPYIVTPTMSILSLSYTSGSTGIPKAVQITEKNLHQFIVNATQQIPDPLITFSFSISDRRNDMLTLAQGGRTCIYTGDPKVMYTEMKASHCTLFNVPPSFFNTLFSEYQRRVSVALEEAGAGGAAEGERGGSDAGGAAGGSASSLRQSQSDMFGNSSKIFSEELKALKQKRRTIKTKVLNEIREIVGKPYVIVTGGAPISALVLRFIKQCFGKFARIYVSYGITEVGAITSNNVLLSITRAQLVDWGDYKVTDRPYPRGQLLAKTIRDTEHYFVGKNNPETSNKEKDSIYQEPTVPSDTHTKNGSFFKTGDIVQVKTRDEVGWAHPSVYDPEIGVTIPSGAYIEIIDRCKNMFKLAQGEYVTPGRLEQIFSESPFIEHILIYGDSRDPYLLGAVVPNKVTVLKWWAEKEAEKESEREAEKKPAGDSWKEICESKILHEKIMLEIVSCANRSRLRPHEIPADVFVDSGEPWSVDNGGITGNNKINRNALRKKYGTAFSDLRQNLAQKNSKNSIKLQELVGAILRLPGNSAAGGKTFVQLGGDSLSAVFLRNEIKKNFNVDISLGKLMTSDVTQLSQKIEAKKFSDGNSRGWEEVDDVTKEVFDLPAEIAFPVEVEDVLIQMKKIVDQKKREAANPPPPSDLPPPRPNPSTSPQISDSAASATSASSASSGSSLSPIDATDEDVGVLVTGTTGFLGFTLLQKLLTKRLQAKNGKKNSGQPKKVYCIIRATSKKAGLERLHNLASQSKLPWLPEFDSMVEVIAGNLSEKLFSISKEEIQEENTDRFYLENYGMPLEILYQKMSEEVTVIYHVAAHVNHLLPYSELKATNVTGTLNVIKFACTSVPKNFHYVSSISVCSVVGTTKEKDVREFLTKEKMAMMDGDENGYTLSKFVGEILVLKSAEYTGIPVAVYRPGFISSHTETGFSNLRDVDNRLVRGIFMMEHAPTSELKMEMVPVDSVAEGILDMSSQPRVFSAKIIHMTNDDKSLPWHLILKSMQSHPKFTSLKIVPFSKWQEQLKNISSKNPLFPITQSHFGGKYFPGRSMAYPNNIRAEFGVVFKQISEDILHKWFDFVFSQNE